MVEVSEFTNILGDISNLFPQQFVTMMIVFLAGAVLMWYALKPMFDNY